MAATVMRQARWRAAAVWWPTAGNTAAGQAGMDLGAAPMCSVAACPAAARCVVRLAAAVNERQLLGGSGWNGQAWHPLAGGRAALGRQRSHSAAAAGQLKTVCAPRPATSNVSAVLRLWQLAPADVASSLLRCSNSWRCLLRQPASGVFGPAQPGATLLAGTQHEQQQRRRRPCVHAGATLSVGVDPTAAASSASTRPHSPTAAPRMLSHPRRRHRERGRGPLQGGGHQAEAGQGPAPAAGAQARCELLRCAVHAVVVPPPSLPGACWRARGGFGRKRRLRGAFPPAGWLGRPVGCMCKLFVHTLAGADLQPHVRRAMQCCGSACCVCCSSCRYVPHTRRARAWPTRASSRRRRWRPWRTWSESRALSLFYSLLVCAFRLLRAQRGWCASGCPAHGDRAARLNCDVGLASLVACAMGQRPFTAPASSSDASASQAFLHTTAPPSPLLMPCPRPSPPPPSRS